MAKTHAVVTPDGVQHLVHKERVEFKVFGDTKYRYRARTLCGLDRFRGGMTPVKEAINVNCALCLAAEGGSGG